MQCFGFVATLGGVRFQPYISNTDFSAENLDYEPTFNLNVFKILCLVSFGILMLAILLSISAPLIYELLMVGIAFFSIYFAYTITISIICCKKEKLSNVQTDNTDEDISLE
jgi:hypothetical protein